MINLKGKLKFLHIGAGDGSTDDTFCDYISKYNWTGTLIEPLPNLYEKLHTKYNDQPNISTLMSGVDFHSNYFEKGYYFKYPFQNNNHCTIYKTKDQAISDISRLLSVENLKERSRFKLLNSLNTTSIRYISYSKILAIDQFDLIHICEPIVNNINNKTWLYIQKISATNNVSMISYDKPGGSSRLCENIDTNIYNLTNKGIGELNIGKFSSPRDYGVDEFKEGNTYNHRIDRNLIQLK